MSLLDIGAFVYESECSFDSFVIVSKPYDNVLRSAVDLSHERNLVVLFESVCLIYRDSVYPDGKCVFRPALPVLQEKFHQVPANHEAYSIDFDLTISRAISPSVGKTVVGRVQLNIAKRCMKLAAGVLCWVHVDDTNPSLRIW